MMKIEDIKVGMNVRRTRAHLDHPSEYPTGYTFTVSRKDSRHVYDECDGAHNPALLEPTDLEAQLTAAQAEVERIKAAIRDRDMPKVGDVITWGNGSIGFKVFGVDGRWLALSRDDDGGCILREWVGLKGLPDFKVVSRASTS